MSFLANYVFTDLIPRPFVVFVGVVVYPIEDFDGASCIENRDTPEIQENGHSLAALRERRALREPLNGSFWLCLSVPNSNLNRHDGAAPPTASQQRLS